MFEHILDNTEVMLNERLNERRENVTSALTSWLVDVARKKPLPDLDVRINEMINRFKRLSENMELKIVDGVIVVKAASSDEDTLKMLRIGTTWFDPDPQYLERIISGACN